MKKLVYLSALASIFFAASCQQENLEPVAADNTVTITVEAPGALNTKAIADGLNVDEVHYAVYKTYSNEEHAIEVEDSEPLAQGCVAMSNGRATINFDLLQDQNFTVIFWAQVQGAGHYTLGDLRNITVKSEVLGNDETRAAFYAKYPFDTYEHKNHTVTLKRPFAQLNLLTTPESLTPVQQGQTTGYEISVEKSEVAVFGLSKTFNTVTGLAAAGDDKFIFTVNATPAKQGQETLTVNGKEYHYVSMNYFFVPQDEKLVDIKYTLETDKGSIQNEIVAVPVKENYRTNVIGNLLTKETTFEIVVDANFDGQELVQEWDGREVSQPVINAAGEYEISVASELAWLAASVNGTLPATKASAPVNFKGQTFKLVEDIDLEGALWTPIGDRSYDHMFAGTFDGNGHVIKNLVVNHADNAGLFGELCGATIKNVTIENFSLTADHYAGAIVGWVEVGATPTLVENCIVRNGEITVNVNNKDLGDKAGSIVGFAHGGTYTNNSADEVVIRGYRDLGGIAGHLQSNGVVSNNKVSNVTIIADQTPEYAETKAANAGKIVGRTAGNASVTENADDNVTVKIFGGADLDVKAAIDNAEAGETIYLAGTYGAFPKVGKALTIICEEGTTFTGNSKLNLNPEAVVIGATFSNPSGTAVDQTITGTFKNCTFTGSNAVRNGYTGTTCYFEDCVFSGAVYGCHFDGKAGNELYFKNCTFSGFNAFAAAIPLTTFDGCTFKSNGKSGYNGANLWGSTKMINTELTFDGSVGQEWIDFIGTDKTYEFTGCTINGGSIFDTEKVWSRNNGTKVTIDGVEYTYVKDGSYYLTEGTAVVTNAAAFNKAAEKETSILFATDIDGDVAVAQKAGVNVTVDGNGKKLNGVLVVDGKSATYTTAGLTLKNLTFAANAISADACVRLGDGTNATRYTCNVTVENCTFDVPGAVAVKSYTGGDKNLTIKGCTVTSNAHSLVQAKGIDGILVENCTVNSKNGMNFNNSTNVVVNNCTTDVRGYSVRFGEGSSASGAAEVYAISNSTLKSACEDGDAVIVLRGTADKSTLTITNTTLEGTIKITNNAVDAKVIIDGGELVNNAEELKGALAEGKDVALNGGNYTLPSVTNGDATISGTKDVVVTISKPNCSGSDLTFNGVTIKGSGYATGVQHVNTVTYNDVTVIGEMCLYGEKVVFNNATFELNNQYIWTYGAKEVEFNNCTFNTNGKAILVYNEGAGATKVTVSGCTFNATAGAKAGAIANQNCAAIEIDNFQSAGTGAAHNVTTSNNTYNNNFSGEWRIKNFVAGNAITVNGVAYESIAIDGKLMTIDSNKNVTVQ